MKISTQTGVIDKAFGKGATLEMLVEAGFDGIDYSLTGNAIEWNEETFADTLSPAFKEYFESEGKRIRTAGIEIVQTHAPYRRPFQYDPEGYAMVSEQTIRAIYATGYMKCPYIVVHPIIHPDFDNGQNRDMGIDANVKYFSKLAPVLKDCKVIACIENLYRGLPNEPKIPNSCSGAQDLCELIDTLNSKHGNLFAACLDTGHALISGNNPTELLRALGKKVRTLHIHDSHGTFDDHLLPGHGAINWSDFIKALYDVGYEGVFNFEADCYFEDYVKEIYSQDVMKKALCLMHSTGLSLVSKATL